MALGTNIERRHFVGGATMGCGTTKNYYVINKNKLKKLKKHIKKYLYRYEEASLMYIVIFLYYLLLYFYLDIIK